MKLYSMRRLSDGRFFIHTDGLGHLRMSTKPVFWRTPDSVWVNLKRVCSEYSPYQDRWGFTQKDWAGFDAKKLAGWEIVVTPGEGMKDLITEVCACGRHPVRRNGLCEYCTARIVQGMATEARDRVCSRAVEEPRNG